jgi:hypothetical protein
LLFNGEEKSFEALQIKLPFTGLITAVSSGTAFVIASITAKPSVEASVEVVVS